MNAEESHEPVEMEPNKEGDEEVAAAEEITAEDGAGDAPEPEVETEVSPVESEAAPPGDEPSEEPAPEPEPVAAEPAEPKPAKPKPKRRAKTKKTEPVAEAAADKTEAAAATRETEAPEESKFPMKWYVIHTYSGHEKKVKDNILRMIHGSSIDEHFGRLIVPTEEVAEMKKGKKTVTTRKFFPSYILIEMFMSDESWHLVNGIPGVTSFIGTGTKPQALLPNEVERILGRMDKDKETIIPEIPYTLGEHIRIKDGPFSDFTGVIDEISVEKGKLRVLVSIFGRETPVELDFLQVETL